MQSSITMNFEVVSWNSIEYSTLSTVNAVAVPPLHFTL